MGQEAATRSVRQILRHDLRTPLSVIIGRCDMLASGAYGPLSEGQRRSVEAVMRNAERLLTEIEHLATHLPPAALQLDIPEPASSA